MTIASHNVWPLRIKYSLLKPYDKEEHVYFNGFDDKAKKLQRGLGPGGLLNH